MLEIRGMSVPTDHYNARKRRPLLFRHKASLSRSLEPVRINSSTLRVLWNPHFGLVEKADPVEAAAQRMAFDTSQAYNFSAVLHRLLGLSQSKQHV